MAFTTRKSRMAIVEETTEGTLKAPSAGTDYLALQDGFSTELTFETLDNEELKASIGKSQSLTGFESPTASLSHYLRHSGTEGQAPQDGYSNLLKAAYGAESVTGAEDTVGVGSTTTSIVVADSSIYDIGDAVLIKHAAFAHEIAVVKAKPTGTTLTPLFTLDNAPASGTGLGKNVAYIAQDEGHPTLSVWDYRGNGAAIAGIAGARVTSLTIDASAGELINSSYSLEGLSSKWNALVVSAGVNDALDFDDGGGQENATISPGAYTPADLAAEIETRMDALTTDDITVTYSDTTGTFTIATDGVTLSLLWNTGTNTATTIGGLLGFSVAADDTGSTSYVSDSGITLTTPQTPSFDAPGTPLVAKNQHIMIGTTEDSVCAGVQTLSYTLEVPKTDELDICAESGKSASIINERTVGATMTLNIDQYKADLFQAMAKNTGVSFQYNFGTKDGAGNWNPGECGVVAIKDATVTVHNLGDSDGLVTLELEIAGFVDSSGNAETSLNFL